MATSRAPCSTKPPSQPSALSLWICRPRTAAKSRNAGGRFQIPPPVLLLGFSRVLVARMRARKVMKMVFEPKWRPRSLTALELARL
jgi:hypothetical protein